MKSFITGYKPGANITLLNTIYFRAEKQPDGSYGPDRLFIVYKDLDTGEKKHEYIENPMFTWYMANENVVINHNQLFIELDKVHPIECRYRDLKASIARETGNFDWFRENIRNGNYRDNDKLFTIPTVFSADINIEDFYRLQFGKLYRNEVFTPSKAFFDIEVDATDAKADFPEMGECPVNAINLIDDKNKKSYEFLLRNPNNHQIEEFEHSGNIGKRLKDFVQQHVGGWKNEARLDLDKFEYKVIFFDDELDMITTFFKLMNYINPDFALAWNMAFDMPYLIARIRTLGGDPNEIISHPDFEIRRADYYVDRRADKFEERGDMAIITCYIVYMCQLIMFASRRKGQRVIGQFNLDYVGEKIAGVKKLDYSAITTNIIRLPYLNYVIFTFYSVMDPIVQKCIEQKVGDVDFVFTKASTMATRYSKVHRQTTYLINRGHIDFQNMGYVLGCNVNKNNPKVGFTGAFTADPEKVSDKPKVKINGYPINVLHNLNDFDYKALYPSNIEQNNIAPNTMRGKIILPEQVDPRENRFNNETFDRAVWLVEDLLSGDVIDFCARYLGLPGYEEMYNLIIKYFRTVKNPARALMHYDSLTDRHYLYNLIIPNQKRKLYHLVDNTVGRNMMVITERMPRMQ